MSKHPSWGQLLFHQPRRRICRSAVAIGTVSIIAMCFACTAPPTAGSSSQLVSTSAQPPSSGPAVVRFDGTYQYVSGKPLAETGMAGTQRMVTCNKPPQETLTIVNGQASYTNPVGVGYHFQGVVGPGGQLVMRAESSTRWGSNEMVTRGVVDESGAIHARQVSANCAYDLIWQKAR